MWFSYRLAAPSGIGSILGAVQVNDEVAVILKVEIHAVIEAGERCVRGSDLEVVVRVPYLLPSAEYASGAGQKKDGLKEHVSNVEFCCGMYRCPV